MKDLRNEEKISLLKKDLQNEKDLKLHIKDICFTEYDELITKIIVIEENSFFKKLEENIHNQLFLYYSNECLKNLNFCKIKEYYFSAIKNSHYVEDKKIILKALNDYVFNQNSLKNSNSKVILKKQYKIRFLSNYFKHCSNHINIAVHSCGFNFLEIYEDDKVDSNFVFVICVGCKYVYFQDCIFMFCSHCKVNYYSKALTEENINQDYMLATWENYHCSTISRDPMKCIKCKKDFYLYKKKNLLTCLNCKFEIEPLLVTWTCIVCKQEFVSNAKYYCSVEFKIVRDSIRNTILENKECKPSSIPCCKLKVEETKIIHKSECNGYLLKGRLFNKDIVVCEKCKALNFLENFIWTCPKCFKKFKHKTKIPIEINKSRNVQLFLKDPITSRNKNDIHLGNNTEYNNETKNFNNQNINSSQILSSNNKLSLYKSRNLMSILEGRKFVNDLTNSTTNCDMSKNIHKLSENSVNCTNNLNSVNKFDLSNSKEKITKLSFNSYFNTNESINKNEAKNYEFKFSDLKVVLLIGEGTYGKIYKVQNKVLNFFAMKKIICHNQKELESTQKEYEIMNSINHDNVVKIIGKKEKNLDETTYALYIVLELAECDLEKQIMNRRKKSLYFNEDELISFIKQLVSCCAFLQNKKICHRDIKPQNILVFNSNIYKLTDFGEAKQKIVNYNSNSIRGSELYMSPILFNKITDKEGNLKSKHNMYKSDVYSLGFCIILAATLSFDYLDTLRNMNDNKQIETYLTKHLEKRYSSKIFQIISKMIKYNEIFRLDFIQLEEYVNSVLI